MTISVLELWGARPLTGYVPLLEEGRKRWSPPERGEPLRDTWALARRSEWRLRNREVDRRGGHREMIGYQRKRGNVSIPKYPPPPNFAIFHCLTFLKIRQYYNSYLYITNTILLSFSKKLQSRK
jgi:hypothetical protein